MAYCRWGADSQVYVYQSVRGIVCYGCDLADEYDCVGFVAPGAAAMIEHLKEHMKRGHRVPASALIRLTSEAEHDG